MQAVTVKPASSSDASSSSSSSSYSYGWVCKSAPVKHTIFLIGCICLLPFSANVLYKTMMMARTIQAAQPDYPYPAIADFTITLAALAVMLPLRYVLTETLFKRFGDWLLPTIQQRKTWNEEIRLERIDRFSTVCFKWAYFIAITIIGYWVLWDVDWLPPALGGKGDIDNCWRGWPFQPIPPYLKEYYLIELAYHVHSIIFHVFTSNRSDYLEMMLHHSTAIYLCLFSYSCNYLRVGSLVLLVHDIADIVGYSIKMSVDTSYTKITLTIYATLLFTWAYTRFYVFPTVIIASIHRAPVDGIMDLTFHDSYTWSYFTSLLYILLFLHIYWYVLFIYMGYKYAVTGITQDLQQKVGGEIENKKGK